jgi:hypothetical protein
MESPSPPAEEFPGLYRSILDGVLELERTGLRREAALVRAEATGIYSGSWDDRGRRRLLGLLRRIDRVRDGRDRPRDTRTGRLVLRRSASPGR